MENEEKVEPGTASEPESPATTEPAVTPIEENSEIVGQNTETPEVIELATPGKPMGKLGRLKHWYVAHKKISIPATILLVVLILAAVPFTRFNLAGLVVKKNLSVVVKDSKTNTPVSGAQVKIGTVSALTDANGKARLSAIKTGQKHLLISKKYYKDQSLAVLVPVIKNNISASGSLVATGRQVTIKVSDYVDDKAIAEAGIEIAGVTAKTDKTGQATVVVPAGQASQKAKISRSGYNDLTVDVKVSEDSVAQTSVKLTPAGKVYFFSKRSGKLDLLKANLDGSDVSTVLAATGSEQVFNSSISQSPDWKYVGLVVKRSSADPAPQLYVLSTADDKLISVDTGNANFTFQGWSGDNLVYTSTRADLPDGQAGKSKLKSYDASTGKITQLDQANGINDASGVAYETYSQVVVTGDTVFYGKSWYVSATQKPQQNTISTISVTGQNHKLVASYATADFPYVNYSQHSANSIYIKPQGKDGTGDIYQYDIGSAAPKKIDIDNAAFYIGTQGYYPSPSGKQMLWTESRDNKNAILVGDQTGGNPATIGTFADYLPFGWYSDRYVILSKSSNEIYVMSSAGGTPLKITDYQITNYYY